MQGGREKCARKFIVCLIVFGFLFIKLNTAQLAFHADANINSFTLKAPGLQQTFTRYFGGQRGNLLQAPGYTNSASATLNQRLQPTSATATAHASFSQPQFRQQLQPHYSSSAVSFQEPQMYQRYQPSRLYQQPSSQQEVIYETISSPSSAFSGAAQAPAYQQQQVTYQQSAPAIQSYSSPASAYQQGAYVTQASSAPAFTSQSQPQQYQASVQPQYVQSIPLTSATADQLQAVYGYQQQARQTSPQLQTGYQGAGYDQGRLLLDLYRMQPSAQGQPLTQAQSSNVYTPEQHFNFLTQQHYDVMRAQQNQLDNYSNYFAPTEAPISTTTAASTSTTVPTTAANSGLGNRYSASTGVSNVNYSSGNLNYKF